MVIYNLVLLGSSIDVVRSISKAKVIGMKEANDYFHQHILPLTGQKTDLEKKYGHNSKEIMDFLVTLNSLIILGKVRYSVE